MDMKAFVALQSSASLPAGYDTEIDVLKTFLTSRRSSVRKRDANSLGGGICYNSGKACFYISDCKVHLSTPIDTSSPWYSGHIRYRTLSRDAYALSMMHDVDRIVYVGSDEECRMLRVLLHLIVPQASDIVITRVEETTVSDIVRTVDTRSALVLGTFRDDIVKLLELPWHAMYIDFPCTVPCLKAIAPHVVAMPVELAVLPNPGGHVTLVKSRTPASLGYIHSAYDIVMRYNSILSNVLSSPVPGVCCYSCIQVYRCVGAGDTLTLPAQIEPVYTLQNGSIRSTYA